MYFSIWILFLILLNSFLVFFKNEVWNCVYICTRSISKCVLAFVCMWILSFVVCVCLLCSIFYFLFFTLMLFIFIKKNLKCFGGYCYETDRLGYTQWLNSKHSLCSYRNLSHRVEAATPRQRNEWASWRQLVHCGAHRTPQWIIFQQLLSPLTLSSPSKLKAYSVPSTLSPPPLPCLTPVLS